jgi:hypothetical protein
MTIISRLVDIASLYSSFDPVGVNIRMLETKTITGGKAAQWVKRDT